jgi:hypothetical protein
VNAAAFYYSAGIAYRFGRRMHNWAVAVNGTWMVLRVGKRVEKVRRYLPSAP